MTFGHVIVWGSVEIRHDEKAQEMWNDMIRAAFGEERFKQIYRRELSIEQTSLGVLYPSHYRIYDLD